MEKRLFLWRMGEITNQFQIECNVILRKTEENREIRGSDQIEMLVKIIIY
ncbi:MAG: hypothetical protein RIT27_1485 [Pseudomonadota bacterium]|jgi:hypothetical protein